MNTLSRNRGKNYVHIAPLLLFFFFFFADKYPLSIFSDQLFISQGVAVLFVCVLFAVWYNYRVN